MDEVIDATKETRDIFAVYPQESFLLELYRQNGVRYYALEVQICYHTKNEFPLSRLEP